MAGLQYDSSELLPYTSPFKNLRLFFDGSLLGDRGGGGFIVYGTDHVANDCMDEWNFVAAKSFAIESPVPSSTAAELEAAAGALRFVHEYFRSHACADHFLRERRPETIPAHACLKIADMV